MIFGVAKAIGREHQAIDACDAVVFDLSEVPHLDVTASMAVENAVKEATSKRLKVFLVAGTNRQEGDLETVDLFSLVPQERVYTRRVLALRDAAESIGVI